MIERKETSEERWDQLDWEEGLHDLFEAMERKLLNGSMSFGHAERIFKILGADTTPSADAEEY